MEKLTHDSEHVTVHGHRGKWYVVDDGWMNARDAAVVLSFG